MTGDNQRLVLAAALLAALLGAQATDLLPSLLAVPPDTACTAARRNVICEDCTTVKNCVYLGGAWYAGKSQTCAAGTPWCQDGACQEDRPASCTSAPGPAPSDSFTCTSDGYLPDPASCSKYWVCVGGNAYAGDCSAYGSAVYDPRSAQCVPTELGSCSTINCTGDAVYQVFETAPWVYAVCTDSNPENALVAACVNQDQRFNGTNCVNACNRAGRFPIYVVDSTIVDPVNMGFYFECVATGDGKTLIGPVVASCPEPLSATHFDVATQRCCSNSQCTPW